jgi:hypothetical protein
MVGTIPSPCLGDQEPESLARRSANHISPENLPCGRIPMITNSKPDPSHNLHRRRPLRTVACAEPFGKSEVGRMSVTELSEKFTQSPESLTAIWPKPLNDLMSLLNREEKLFHPRPTRNLQRK